MRTLALAAAAIVASSGISAAQDATAGETSFKRSCVVCHSIGDDAKIKLGPPLNGLEGRKAGSFAGFKYSDAMKDSDITWSADSFPDFIQNPARQVKGTRMTFLGIKDHAEVMNLWEYLRQFDAEGKEK